MIYLKFKLKFFVVALAFSMMFNNGIGSVFADNLVSENENNESSVTSNKITWLTQNVWYFDDNYDWYQDQWGGGFHEGLACVYYSEDGKWENSKYGFVDENDKIVIPLEHNNDSSFTNGIEPICYRYDIDNIYFVAIKTLSKKS